MFQHDPALGKPSPPRVLCQFDGPAPAAKLLSPAIGVIDLEFAAEHDVVDVIGSSSWLADHQVDVRGHGEVGVGRGLDRAEAVAALGVGNRPAAQLGFAALDGETGSD